MATRAVASEDKQIRRNAILEAARNLFTSGDGTLPTASEIASVTGLAKGTVYLYFETKEEIFATLLVEGWRPFMQTIPTIFTGSKVRRAHKIKLFISSLVKPR
jgi:AcrR family transcriptional regulator